VKAEARVKALLTANRKKSVHVSLFSKTHIDFKKAVIDRDLSMQEVFEYFATQFAEGHPALVKIIEQYCQEKKENLVQRLEEKYTENLYDAIGFDNPLKR
tara:strand:+ start:1580 stop:1879 length:300 start_codon:yes stop_codon:yes gene_type:complete